MNLSFFVQTVAEALFEKVQVEEKEAFGHTVLNLKTDDATSLLKHDAEGLRALNHIVKRVQEKDAGAPVVVDVNNHDTEKLERIVAQALELAERVKKEAHEIELQPMNSYERLLVHDALKEVSGVRTESRGEGRERHIVLVHEKD